MPDLQATLHREPQRGEDICLHPVRNIIVFKKNSEPGNTSSFSPSASPSASASPSPSASPLDDSLVEEWLHTGASRESGHGRKWKPEGSARFTGSTRVGGKANLSAAPVAASAGVHRRGSQRKLKTGPPTQTTANFMLHLKSMNGRLCLLCVNSEPCPSSA